MENQKFSCIIVDLNLGSQPNGGKKIIKNLKHSLSFNLNKTTPVILCSGFIDVKAIEELKPFISDAVTKPLNIKLLVQKIKTVIEANKGQEEPKKSVIL